MADRGAKLPSAADLISGRPSLGVERSGVTAARPGAVPDFGAAVEGQQAFSKAVAGLSGDIATATLREKARFDDMRVEDAFNQLREKQLDLTLGQENGFANLKGGDAVKRPVLKEWGTKFDDAARSVEETLTDDQQKERFRLRVGIARASFNGDLLRHVSHEANNYAQAVFKGTVDLETRSAMSNWNDGNAIGLSLARIGNAVTQEADRQGWGKDDPQRAALGMHAVSALHASVIAQALQAGDPSYAQKYFEANKDSIDPSVVKTLGHQVAEGVQKHLASGYQTQFLAAREDIRGLTALEKKVTGDQSLDEDRKNILLGRIEARRDRLVTLAMHEEDRRIRQVRSQIDAVNKVTLAGYEPTAEQMLPLIQAAKGTELEGDVSRMIATANATKAFRNALPQQQEATITQLEAAARKDPTKFDVTVIDRFKKIYSNQQNEIRQDPITFAARQGLVKAEDPAAQALDLSNPANLGDGLKARFDLARAMAARYQAPVKPLTKEEADTLAGVLKAGTVEQKTTYFSQLVTAASGDFDGYKALIAQIAPDDPVTAHAGIMAGRGRMTTNAGFEAEPGKSTNVAQLILRGQQVLHPNRKEDGSPEKGKLWPLPKDEDMAKVFQSSERDAFAGKPDARNGFYQTAKAIYAARTVEAGDSSGVLDASRWQEAIKLSTGGIERWNGKSILMPWGYSAGQFKDELYRRIDDMADAERLPKGVTAGKLRDMPLESIGDGRYMFRAGDGILVDKDARPVVVDFNQSPAFRSSGYGLTPQSAARQAGVYDPTPASASFFRGGK